jgi:O-methyltransferase
MVVRPMGGDPASGVLMKAQRFAKDCVRGFVRLLGYELQSLEQKAPKANQLHERITPFATYSPWNRDRNFLKTYDAIKEFTLVDKYRCFELWSLVEQATKLRGSLIEVGVWRGGTGALLAQRVEQCGNERTVYLCDTFTGVVKATNRDPVYKGGEHSDTSRKTVEHLIEKLQLKNVVILEGIFPDDTARSIEGETFAFCHIDVDVYKSAKEVFEWIWPRMVVGGIIVYDDFGFLGCQGVTAWVEEQTSRADSVVVYNLNGHAVVMKIS